MDSQEALNTLVDLVKQSSDFAKQQLPEVVQQKIAYTVWSDWLGIKVILSILAILLVASIVSIIVKKFHDSISIFIVLFFAGIFFGGIIGTSCYLEIVKIEKAPKAYAVEYLSSLVK